MRGVLEDHIRISCQSIVYRANGLSCHKTADPEGLFLEEYDTSCLEYLFLKGERADPDTINWAESQLGVPVIDHWWQTETGWSICATNGN